MRSASLIASGVRMPAGEYFVGDPCYAVPDDRWMEWLEAADYTNGHRFLLAELDGYPVLGVGTAYGDGAYPGTDGNTYPVDAGLIGLVPVQVATDAPFGMVRHTFTSDFECSYQEDSGKITLGHIAVFTDLDDEPDYYDDPEGDDYYPQGEDQ